MRIALFIDGIHFYRSFGQSQHEIDYDAMAQWIVQNIHTQPQNIDFVGGYYYTYDFEQPNLQRFLDGLSCRKGFFVQKIPYVGSDDSDSQLDHSLVISTISADCTRLAALNHFDIAVFFTQHHYLLPIVQNLKFLGKHSVIATTQSNCTPHILRQEVFDVLSLQEGLGEFTLQKKSHKDDQSSLMINLLWEVEQAVSFFQRKNRPVTRWYFENQWLSSRLCPNPGSERTEFVEMLIKQGNLELFETTVNGRTVIAIRPKE